VPSWHFSDRGDEFTVQGAWPDRPWVNYLTNGRFFALVSQAGGGFAFYLDPLHHQVTRREQDMLISDQPGFLLYLAVDDAGGERLWSFAERPPASDAVGLRATHGFGYTQLRSRWSDIEASVRFFVPLDADALVWRITASNVGEERRRVRLIAYQEWQPGSGAIDGVARRFDSFFKPRLLAGRRCIGPAAGVGTSRTAG